MAQRGVETVEIVRAREMNVKNGCPAKRSPCIGLETEAERRSRRSNGFASFSLVVAKVQVGNVDLVMVAQALLRASERPCRVPVPVRCESGDDVRCTDPKLAEMRLRRATNITPSDESLLHNEHPACGWFAESTVNLGHVFAACYARDSPDDMSLILTWSILGRHAVRVVDHQDLKQFLLRLRA